jgi:lactoylglutathione lyase
MKGNKKTKLTNLLLAFATVFFMIDIAMKISSFFPLSLYLFKNSKVAYAEEKGEKKDAMSEEKDLSSGPIFFYPPFPIEKGRIRLFHLGLRVKDLDKSVDFYCNKLGFKLLRTQDMGFIKMAFISTGDGEPLIELEQITQDIKGFPKEGFSHVGLFVYDVDDLYKVSKEKGVKWEGMPASPGPGAPYMGFMIDPDGYRIEIMENPKGSKAYCQSCHRGPHLN